MSTPDIPNHPDATIADTLTVDHDKVIIAYQINKAMNMPIVRAPQERVWMDETRMRFAYRCLPLLIANQHGWLILNDQKFKAEWNGGEDMTATRIKWAKGSHEPYSALSHFGHGIITFSIPYLFRTPKGYNLIARGPTNSFKDGIHPLDGIIETDWNRATFTMNWIFTRSDYPVVFEKDEPICMIYPVKRGEIEQFDAEVRDLDTNPELKRSFDEWSAGRMRFNEQLHVSGSEEARQLWQKDYFQGRVQGSETGERFEGHQTRLNIKDFKEK
ncbi:MAG: DUF6065 family protein [Chloroflexota bacterium]|nr:DUF6065 family protein [Chloroflexota bacterium]